MHDLDDDLGFEPPEDDEPLELVGDVDANRMLRRLRAAEGEAARVRELAAEDMAQTMRWRDRRLESIERTIAWARRSLEGWLRVTHDAGGPQTVKLPAGQVQLRKVQPRIEVDTSVEVDDAMVAAWVALAASAEVTEAPIITKRSLSKKVVGAIVSAGPSLGPPDPDGFEPHAAMGPGAEVVPGVTVHVPTQLAFNAKTAVAEEDLEASIEEATGA